MPRTEKTKESRIQRVFGLIKRCPAGITELEIAEQLNLERRSVNNYLRELESRALVYKENEAWFDLRTSQMQLRSLELLPEEAITLYLAIRLYVKQMDKRHEPGESALNKLAEVLTSDIGLGYEIHQAAQELASRPGDHTYSQIFNTIVQGYMYRRAVDIIYAPRSGRPFETRLCPYLLEPSAIGYTTYVIGYSSTPDTLRTYKMGRIQTATLTEEEYSIPRDFPGLEILRNAWSIIIGEDLKTVVLRFHPSVIDRVNETRWHPSEEKRPDPDRFGWLRWTAQVADTTDMLPWIRGWGADVEVLEPQSLRDEIIGESRYLAELYGWKIHRLEDESDMDDLNQTFRDYFDED
jgi:CRISPR-associated endonuclease/helicase Cas3